MTWDSFQEPPGGQGSYIEYGPYRPVQAPLFPNGYVPGEGNGPGAGGSAASEPLSLREAIKQLPFSRIYPSVDKPQVAPSSCFFRARGPRFEARFTRGFGPAPERSSPQAFRLSDKLPASFAKLRAAFKSRSSTKPHAWQ